MKVAHTVVITPGRCGLYETTREVVVALRDRGIDSRMVDPGGNKVYPDGYPHPEDRGAPVASMEWAIDADIIVNHSGYDGTPLDKTGQPIVHVAHGRPRSSFLSERKGGTPIYSYHFKKNYDPRWRAVVTFWPEHVQALEVMFPDKPVRWVPAPVDLNYWCPGESSYDFHGHKGAFNVVITDAWRDDVDPFWPMLMFGRQARMEDGWKLHVYGVEKDLRGFAPIIRRLQADGNMGELCRWTKNLRDIYRAADLVLTGNQIDTRAKREALACGCPVSYAKDNFVGSLAWSVDRERARKQAVEWFNPERTAVQFEDILCSI